MSDKCPAGPSADSPLGFKSSLLRYLQHYEVSAVQQFISAIQKCDMSGIKTAFISSVPGSHKVEYYYNQISVNQVSLQDGAMCLWGHRAMAKLLRSHVPVSTSGWEVVAQCSSIGSLGATPDIWLESQLGASLASSKSRGGPRGRVSLIYPSHADVLSSYDGLEGGGCLPYSR